MKPKIITLDIRLYFLSVCINQCNYFIMDNSANIIITVH